MNWQEFKDQIDDIRKNHTIIEIAHDDQPDNVADAFVRFLRKEGYDVEMLCHDDVPSLFYKIVPKK